MSLLNSLIRLVARSVLIHLIQTSLQHHSLLFFIRVELISSAENTSSFRIWIHLLMLDKVKEHEESD